jgi:hypothetical protein
VTLIELGSILGYFETLKPAKEVLNSDPHGAQLYSRELVLTGNHWRRVSYGAKLQNNNQQPHSSEQLLFSFIKLCSKLEELCIPMTQEHVELSKSNIMIWTPKLHTLF